METMAMTELLRKLEFISGVPLFYVPAGSCLPESVSALPADGNPIRENEALRELLAEKSSLQREPYVLKDENQVYFICIRSGAAYYMAGPVCTELMSRVELHRYYRSYHISVEAAEERHPVRMSTMKIFTFASLLAQLFKEEAPDAGEIMRANGMVTDEKEAEEKEDAALEMRKIDRNQQHHTYREESRLMECIRQGDVEHVMEMHDALHETSGVLSKNEFNNQRNLAIVNVTTGTRAAIEGGLPPAEAYRMSDVFINQIDECTSIEQLMDYIRKTTWEFTKKVAEYNSRKKVSGYVEQCRRYIDQHYHHKIYLEDMAGEIGVSEGHLSRIFHRDTGMSIQEYISRFRVERAANLLKYSDASISEISDYVCFHSQSHFGSVFKKYKNMTPKEYRERYKRD